MKPIKSVKAVASEIEHAIRHEITLKIQEDEVFYLSLQKRLEEIIEIYTQGRIALAEQIKRLKALVVDLQKRPDIAKNLGLNISELAFFNLNKEKLKGTGIEEEREIVEFTYEILESIEPFTSIVDWNLKQDTIRQIRKACKEKLIELRERFPIDKQDYNQLAQQIVELAKVHFVAS